MRLEHAIKPESSMSTLLWLRFRAFSAPIFLLTVWLLLIIATAIYRPDFISYQTLLAVVFTMSIVGVLAIGQALVTISGGFLDLSQPSCLIFASFVSVKLSEAGMPFIIVILGAIITGVIVGAINALIIVLARLNPIIVTLATNFIGLAVLFLLFRAAEVPIGSEIHTFGRAYFLGLPATWWPMLILIFIVGLLIHQTRYGRQTIAVGGNLYAAQTRGISLKKTRFLIFSIAGGFVGFAAILFCSASGPFNSDSANILQLNVIAAVILAGISLEGGRGHLWMLFLSVGLLSTVPTSLVFFGLSSDAQAIFQGLILVLAVTFDGYRPRKITL